jgi:hypothetical protein
MIVSDVSGWVWKEPFLPNIKMLYQECLERQDNHKEPRSGWAVSDRDSNQEHPEYEAGAVTSGQCGCPYLVVTECFYE